MKRMKDYRKEIINNINASIVRLAEYFDSLLNVVEDKKAINFAVVRANASVMNENIYE